MSGPDSPLDAGRGLVHVLVFPHTDDKPPRLAQANVAVPVPLNVGRELLGPPLTVRFWRRRMNGTAVPEATIDVHGNSSRPEDEISAPSRTLDRRDIDPIPQTSAPNRFAKLKFRRSVSAGLALHSPANVLR